MGNYLADGLMAGYQAGSAAYHKKKEREQKERENDQKAIEAAADRSLRRELLEKDISARSPLVTAQADNLTANTERTRALTPEEVSTERARARSISVGADRVETLTPGELEELNARARSLNASAAHTESATQLDRDVHEMKMNELRRTVEGGPTAKVKQSLGPGSEAEFSVPIAEARRMASTAAYQSPYADRIAAYDDRIAQHEAAMQGGDERTGLFNLKSREDERTKLTQQRTRLQFREIQDQLQKGLIDDAEADRRAAALLKFAQ